MNTINVDLSTGEALNLPIGRQGENNVTQVIFDFSGLKTEFGSGTLSLSVKRPKEYIPYAQTMTVSGNTATWLVNETDTGNFGCGEIQLTYTVSGKVAKTVIYKYTVLRSIGADGEYPIPGQTWQEEMEAEIDEIKQDLADHEDRIDALEQGGSIQGLTEEFKQALHDIIEQLGFEDDEGRSYLSALDNAMWPPKPATAISVSPNTLSFVILNSTQQLSATVTPSDTTDSLSWSSSDTSVATVSNSGLVTAIGYGSATITVTAGSVSATCSVVVAQATVSSISAVYTQSGTVYDTASLDSLKSDLVVTATYTDSSTETVPSADYTLSGTLEEGTSTITVSYAGKTTTFDVTVTHFVDTSIYNWDFTKSLTDSVGGVTAVLGNNATQDSSGVHLTGANAYCFLGNVFSTNRTIEIDVAELDFKFSSGHGRLAIFGGSGAYNGGDGLIYRSTGHWTIYFSSWATPSATYSGKNDFTGKTIKLTMDSNREWKAYCDGTLFATLTDRYDRTSVTLGTSGGNVFYNAVISGVRIYEGVV